MKTPDDFGKGLDVIQRKLESYDRLESTYSQVSKALCGKEKATLDELLQAVYQLKADRYALGLAVSIAQRGVCEENSKEDKNG